ncbi:MAG: iron-sulfur cluster loop [Candidatus Aenigmarchaeota archaeon]|nr:iron-sulfur cluster loop [Candidatus Aenigmarchaeota archaeon]
MITKQQTAQKIIDFGKTKEVLDTENGFVGQNEDINRFLKDTPFAYILGVLYDQWIPAERAWSIPYYIYRELGHLNVKKIAKMKSSEILEIFERTTKPIHPLKMARQTINAAKLIVKKYNGNAEIWSDLPRCKDLEYRFKEFDGFGQKKASMAVNILMRKWNIDLIDKSGIDVSYDVHIGKVFYRTGIIERNEKEEAIFTARQLNPKYPGIFDKPCWIIGRKYCFEQNPNCNKCPLKAVCKYN